MFARTFGCGPVRLKELRRTSRLVRLRTSTWLVLPPARDVSGRARQRARGQYVDRESFDGPVQALTGITSGTGFELRLSDSE
jgi:hypothetical protein